MSSPLVSIIIPNWNGEALLSDCLAALAAQTWRPLEVILVDNASSDGSVALFHAWEAPAGIDKIELTLAENMGFAVAVNRGMEVAGGAFVALLNNDTEADPQWISALVAAMQERQEVGFCASKLLLFDERERLDTAGHGFSSAGAGFARLRWAPDGEEANRKCEVFGACAAASIYRREALTRVGMLDESFFMYQEDLDLDCRMQLAGYRCLYVPEAVVYHKVSASSGGTRSNFIVYYSSRNQEWLYLKNMPGYLFWTRLPAHCLYNFGRFAVYALKGQAWPYLKGKWHALTRLGEVWRQRKQIQAARVVSPSEFASRFDRHWFRRHFLDHLRAGKKAAK